MGKKNCLCIFSCFDHFETIFLKAHACDYNYNFCEKTLMTKAELMKHKKSKHREHVQDCKNDIENNCRFGSMMGWFIHKTYQNKINESMLKIDSTSNELTEKLIKKIQEHTEKIKKLESITKKCEKK